MEAYTLDRVSRRNIHPSNVTAAQVPAQATFETTFQRAYGHATAAGGALSAPTGGPQPGRRANRAAGAARVAGVIAQSHTTMADYGSTTRAAFVEPQLAAAQPLRMGKISQPNAVAPQFPQPLQQNLVKLRLGVS